MSTRRKNVKLSLVAIATAAVATLLASGSLANAERSDVVAPPRPTAAFTFDQVRTSGEAGPLDQAITIVNNSDSPQDLSNFKVEYANTSSELITLAVIPPGTVLEPKKTYVLANIDYSGPAVDQYFTQELTAPFVLGLLTEDNAIADSASIPPGICPSGVYVRGIPGSLFYCAPPSEDK
jgi:hypothetical protein